MQTQVWWFLAVIVLVNWPARPAFAYLDTATGSMLLQLLIVGAASVSVIAKILWRRLRTRTTSSLQDDTTRVTPSPQVTKVARSSAAGGKLGEFLSQKKEAARFLALPPNARELVFYAEGAHDWPHWAAMVQELTEHHRQPVAYLTSQKTDPVLAAASEYLHPFWIGDGLVRTSLFRSLPKCVCVMTLTDLDQLYLKRSLKHVHYVYVFHSLNSTHMAYRQHAFAAYDTILCAGPHHVKELRQTNTRVRTQAQNLVAHGYERLDQLLEEAKHASTNKQPSQIDGARDGGVTDSGEEGTRGPLRVVYAPSWGPGSSIDLPDIKTMLASVLEQGFDLSVRLHPMTVRHNPTLKQELKASLGHHGARFRVISNMHERASLLHANVMISDWSGAALEFALGLLRPVLFIETPPKVRNPKWQSLPIEPAEVALRNRIGATIPPGALQQIPDVLRQLAAQAPRYRERIKQERKSWVFNLGNSAQAGAKHIVDLIHNQRRNLRSGASQSSFGGNSDDQGENIAPPAARAAIELSAGSSQRHKRQDSRRGRVSGAVG